MPKPYTRWTEDTRTAFLLALKQEGRVREAAAAIGRSAGSAYDVRKRDPAFRARWDAIVAEAQAAAIAAARAAREGLSLAEREGRERLDGWTATTRARFIALLSQGETVKDACTAVGLSDTSAYALRKRSVRFAADWARALTEATLSPLEAAYVRAVEGWDEPVVFQGQVVAHKRRYSDAALRLLLQREDRRLERAEAAAAATQARETKYYADPEDTNRALLKKLDQLEKARALRLAGVREAGGGG